MGGSCRPKKGIGARFDPLDKSTALFPNLSKTANDKLRNLLGRSLRCQLVRDLQPFQPPKSWDSREPSRKNSLPGASRNSLVLALERRPPLETTAGNPPPPPQEASRKTSSGAGGGRRRPSGARTSARSLEESVKEGVCVFFPNGEVGQNLWFLWG